VTASPRNSSIDRDFSYSFFFFVVPCFLCARFLGLFIFAFCQFSKMSLACLSVTRNSHYLNRETSETIPVTCNYTTKTLLSSI
jgi:hypothetical protein